MIELGIACLVGGLIAFLYGAGAALYGGFTRDRRWVDSSRRAVYAAAILLTVCVVVLEAAFLRDDFSVELVADHSSTTTPTLYKMTAMWGSQGGSLLLWAWVLSLAASGVLFATRHKHREVVPWATAVLCGLGIFFTGLMLIAGGANPFARLSPVPAEGVGLNPLLRHPAMAIHPPMLYSGYVLFSIPFAFAIGALVARRLDASWIRSTRRFGLLAWIFLTCGVLLGAGWSYMELGWGGYWGWDPVENASLMPWLVGTAFLHSIMVQERRGMLKVWNVSLICATFALCLLGTFLVRSGILESIHAFGASTVGTPLLGLIAVVLVGSTVLIVSRQRELRAERRLESLASREAVFLVNNLLLVGLCLIVFWGTFFPLISEAITGERSSLGGPWFDRYVTPLALGLVLFTGIGPLLAWRRLSAGRALRLFGPPIAFATVVTVVLALFTSAADEPLALVMFAFAAFALAGLAGEFARGASAQRALAGGSWPAALGRLVSRNRRRYGGYIVHIGVAIAFVAVAASSSFQTSRDIRMLPGDTTRGRGLHGHLRARVHERGRGGGTAHVRGRAEHRSRGRAIRPDPVPELLLGPLGRHAGVVLRGRGHQRGRALGRRGRGPLDRDAARPDLGGRLHCRRRPQDRPDHAAGRRRDARPERTRGRRADAPDRRGSRPVSGNRRAEPPKPLRRGRAAGRLPDQREPDGHLDLDRRGNGRDRRPAGRVAGGRGASQPRFGRTRGPARARSRPRLIA